jgi:hypothetical protein
VENKVLFTKETVMNSTLRDYILSFIPNGASIPDTLTSMEETQRQAAKSGLVLALLQNGILPEEIRQLLGIGEEVEDYELLKGAWIPSRHVTITQLIAEVQTME